MNEADLFVHKLEPKYHVKTETSQTKKKDICSIHRLRTCFSSCTQSPKKDSNYWFDYNI